jgi:hypothetical protein
MEPSWRNLREAQLREGVACGTGRKRPELMSCDTSRRSSDCMPGSDERVAMFGGSA